MPELPHTVDVTSDKNAAAALRTFFRIAEQWSLSTTERATLLGIARSTYYRWRQKKVPRLERESLERMSYVFGIYKSLQILFPTSERAARWLRAPSKAAPFDGNPALDRMLSGKTRDLFLVRRYLDAQRS